MRKKIILSIFLIFICLTPFIVNAEDRTCEYDNGLTLYYENGGIDYDYEALANKWYRMQSILWDASVDDFYTGEEVLFKGREELEEIYDKPLCPNVYLCEETSWGIELPSLFNLSGTIGHTLSDVIAGLSAGYLKFDKYFGDHYWSLFHISSKNLYIMGPKTYKDLYEGNEGGYFYQFMSDGYVAGADWCTLGDGINFAEGTVDLVCGTIGSLIDGIWDLATSNDEMLLSYKELHCYYYKGNYNLRCSIASANLETLENYIDEYKNCGENDKKCRDQKKIQINGKVDVLRKQCDAIFSNFDYYEADEKECIEKCFSVAEKISEINETNKEGKCGFSWNLINFVSNIVKWGKYIVPVIVIVMGIIDFIKAISSNKDDEMKKAQRSFVRRLIVCGLIFILPFIIEFILNKMGFDANGCGIIDL